ncbi:flagellar biosynthesis protein FlaG [Sulfolobus sp. A20]|uniref:flagellar biosynthesis protein FlaG n=1 Tax=Saccharolobus sp. A20 TaxID=1891280 RepID=UPI00084611D9|nr:flagellar biosynthesis protein FlaG [Sulfolobus sp. A20]TRM72980.1 flagellar biosynthesis protein FlaG [Sulfolobus sp. E5]TRM77971.1 flagellar biosynthesis protein FlaG [Sulfolobus sp. A20-N-F8]TRM82973.1 flagellar biosynthesis protein FlaG [Sulfolobus sp. A20-N-F6]TRM89290.1 flagellar biosynthesis protein FlaG [Sulfolobus sp. E3]TRM99434.1 flagellar biosynthesis protein FlaG [Sulfolobus sp. E1]TRN02223.1 flagellar biosynthesis protein FlaG [Sulfolobus sp. F1]
MTSEVISESIMLIVAITLIGVLAGIVFSVVSSIATSMSSNSILESQRLLTDLQIDYATNTSPTIIVVYLHNVGEVTVYNLQDGVLYFGADGNLQQIGFNSGIKPYWIVSTNTLNPGSVAEITIYLSSPLSSSQYYTIEYVTSYGYIVTYALKAN